MGDFMSDIEMWADMWDEVQEDEEFNEPTPYNQMASPIDDEDQSLYARMMGMDTGDEEVLLQETTKRKSPNPVYPDSIGEDGRKPNPAWVDENVMKEIQGLKDKLFKLENKAAQMGTKKKVAQPVVEMKFGEKISSEIQQLRKRIDRISDNLGIKDEPSPWEIKDQE